MNTLTKLRDQVYLGRFTESIRLQRLDSNNPLGLFYLRTHSIYTPNRHIRLSLGDLLGRDYRSGEGYCCGYGDCPQLGTSINQIYRNGLGYGFGFLYGQGAGDGQEWGYRHGWGMSYLQALIRRNST